MLFSTDPTKESSCHLAAGFPRSGTPGDDPKGQAGRDPQAPSCEGHAEEDLQ